MLKKWTELIKSTKCKFDSRQLDHYRELKGRIEKSAVVLRLDDKDPILYSESSLRDLDNNNTLRYEMGLKIFKAKVSETQKEWEMMFKKFKIL